MKRLALAAFLFLALLIVGCSGDGQTADDVVPKSTLTPVPPTSSSHSVAMPTETPVVSTDPKTTITPVAHTSANDYAHGNTYAQPCPDTNAYCYPHCNSNTCA